LQLNPDNLVATVNLKCNRALQAGRHLDVRDPQAVLDEFGHFRGWDEIMGENGRSMSLPFVTHKASNSTMVVSTARPLVNSSGSKSSRPAIFTPVCFWAIFFLTKQRPDETLKIVQEIHSRPDIFPVGRTNLGEIVYLEASALLAKKDLPAAEKILNNTLDKYPTMKNCLRPPCTFT